MNYNKMKTLGLTDRFIEETKKYENLFIGRVSSQYRDLYDVITEFGVLTAEVSGKFRYLSIDISTYPAVGDFVMIDRLDSQKGNAIIHHVLSRKSAFIRKVAGRTSESQVVASNIDTVFICMSLNNDFNHRRLERYLAIAWDSGAVPVIVLTKSDLCLDIESKLKYVSTVGIGVDILVTTSLEKDGYKAITPYLLVGKTIAFIGSSGVGKSTLINRLICSDILGTSDIRNDDRGRHTTTRRELIILPEGAIVIDTPGMREIGIISGNLSKTFTDIDEIALNCEFADCKHEQEPNCAVKEAISEGSLTKERFNSYKKLLKETKYDGLNSKMIEKEKVNEMFSGLGGMKNARKFIKEMKKRR